ncbi:MAG: hypothetical protein MJY66_07790 [Bacteroidaceae bacterium]|nr:hypothetical protein [Bacteroidaceae bacterium]
MKQLIHCCFTSHNEVMFRDRDDVNYFLNVLATTSWAYGIEIFADVEMSNHVHLLVMASEGKESRLISGTAVKTVEKDGLSRTGKIQYSSSDRLSYFVSAVRKKMTRHFYEKYDRKNCGRLGERSYFSLLVQGNYHMISACSYVLRNPMHHGVAVTPFSYPYSSANDIFPVELGKTDRPYPGISSIESYRMNMQGKWVKKCSNDRSANTAGNIILPPGYAPITGKAAIRNYLPRDTEFPDEWIMSPEGVFLRPCFEELRQTEMLFASASAFEYNMFRKTDEKWLQEQNQDRNGLSLVRLDEIEPLHSNRDIETYLKNERNRTYVKCFNDFDVCRIVDHDILPEFHHKSIYQLTDAEKLQVRKILINEIHVPDFQASRCI